MARPLRIEYDGALYHVMSRTNAREPLIDQDRDKALLLDTLSEVIEKHNWLCHAYCLMDNHYHLVIETPDGNLSTGMRGLNGVFTQRLNKTKDRVGHVFQGRYKAVLVQKDSYLLEVARYVVINPVSAKLATAPGDYRWSSYPASAGLTEPHDCLTVDWLLAQFYPGRNQAQAAYREFVEAGRSERSALAGHRVILGDKDFIAEIAKHLKDPELLAEIPRRQRFLGRPSLDALLPKSGDRSKRNQRIKEAVYEWGYGQKEVADIAGLHPSTISRLLSGN